MIALFAMGIVMTQLVGQEAELDANFIDAGFEEWAGEAGLRVQYFGTVQKSMMTLMGCVTDGCHQAVFVPLCEAKPYMVILVIMFVSFLVFGLANILIGIF